MKIKQRKLRPQVVHRYYRSTGFYGFIGSSMKKALPAIILFILTIILVDIFVIDIRATFTEFTKQYNANSIFSVFFISESLLGLIPPEIFIAWSLKSASPFQYIFLLALFSYLGGTVSYFIGKWILSIPKVYNYLEVKMSSHIRNIRKWGGFMIIVGALLPIPFSMTSMAAGVINYRFKDYLLFGSLRFIRFFVFAVGMFFVI